MLVLTRKKEESVRIGDKIEVVVLEVTGKRVRLGFRCPPEVPIHRAEMFHEETLVLREAEVSPELELACV